MKFLLALLLTVVPVTFDIEVRRQINAHRAEHGVHLVRQGPCLERQAERYADRLARRGELVHSDLSRLLDRCGGSWVGEILSGGYDTPETVVGAWLASQSHHRVLSHPRARRMGVGTARDSWGRLYVVVNFKGL